MQKADILTSIYNQIENFDIRLKWVIGLAFIQSIVALKGGDISLIGLKVTPIQAFTILWFIFCASAIEILLRVKKVGQLVQKLDKSDVEKALSSMQSNASIFNPYGPYLEEESLIMRGFYGVGAIAMVVNICCFSLLLYAPHSFQEAPGLQWLLGSITGKEAIVLSTKGYLIIILLFVFVGLLMRAIHISAITLSSLANNAPRDIKNSIRGEGDRMYKTWLWTNGIYFAAALIIVTIFRWLM